VPPPTHLSYISFFLLFPCHTQEHFSPVFSGSKRDVCAGAWLSALGCESGCPLTKQKFITGGEWPKNCSAWPGINFLNSWVQKHLKTKSLKLISPHAHSNLERSVKFFHSCSQETGTHTLQCVLCCFGYLDKMEIIDFANGCVFACVFYNHH